MKGQLVMTIERLVELIRRSNKTFWLSSGSDGYSVKIECREYKITAEQYNYLLNWSLSSAAM